MARQPKGPARLGSTAAEAVTRLAPRRSVGLGCGCRNCRIQLTVSTLAGCMPSARRGAAGQCWNNGCKRHDVGTAMGHGLPSIHCVLVAAFGCGALTGTWLGTASKGVRAAQGVVACICAVFCACAHGLFRRDLHGKAPLHPVCMLSYIHRPMSYTSGLGKRVYV